MTDEQQERELYDAVIGTLQHGGPDCVTNAMVSAVTELVCSAVRDAATSMRSACIEKVKSGVLGEREIKRIGSQIVGDVLAQMGVRGSKEEREGADVVASAWVAKVVERVNEESMAALESVTIQEQK